MVTYDRQSFWSKFYPWLVWGFGALFLLYKYLLETSPSVMGSALMRDFHLSGAALGNLAAAYFYAYLIMQIPMGVFTDRFGPRKVTTICIALTLIGTLILATAHQLWVADVGRFITGIGAAVAALSCLKLTTLWFPARRFPLMAGLMMCLGMLGAVSAEAPLSLALSAFGWRHSMLYLVYIGIGFAIIYWLVVRDHGPHAPEPYAQDENETKKLSFLSSIKEILSSKQSWYLSIYSGLAFAPVSVFGGLWGVPFLEAAHGFSRTAAAEQVSCVFIGFAIGAPIWGWLAERLGKQLPIMRIGTIIALIAAAVVIYVPHLSDIGCTILLLIFGISISTFLLCFSMIRQVNRLILAATAIGFMNSFDALLGAVTDPFIGKILDFGWAGATKHGARVFTLHDYHIGMFVIVAYLLLSLLTLFFIRETFQLQK